MVYFYNVPWDCSAHTLIGHGDYRRRKFFDDQTYQWLGAYGSNLSLARIQNRIGNINNHVTGHLPGYGLVFNKSCRSGACANIQYTGDKADQCPVVAYQLSETQCLSLDDYEGAPTHYLRICVPMRVGNEIRLMQTYIAHPQMLIDQQYPDPAYLAFIEQGYREHSLGQLDVGHLPQPQG